MNKSFVLDTSKSRDFSYKTSDEKTVDYNAMRTVGTVQNNLCRRQWLFLPYDVVKVCIHPSWIKETSLTTCMLYFACKHLIASIACMIRAIIVSYSNLCMARRSIHEI